MSPIPLGFWATAGAGGGAAAGAYELISTTLVSSAVSSVSFDLTGLSATYKHLQIRSTVRSARSDNADTMRVRFNNISSSAYSWHHLYGEGSAVGATYGTSDTGMRTGLVASATNSANIYSGVVIDLVDAFGTKNKTIRTLTGSHTNGATYITLASGLWFDTTAATSLQLSVISGNNIASGSRFSLYGIKG